MADAGCIYVLAGTNGAGKSSLVGASFREEGLDYFDPDEATGEILAANPGMELDQANILAWEQGKRMLERAIDEGLRYAFETTLGGTTITTLLKQAAEKGVEVRLWYAGLASPELHIERVKSRVKHGGHDIPEKKIRFRYDESRKHLIELLPYLAELYVYDNSAEADPKAGKTPEPILVLKMERGAIVDSIELARTPEWAKPIVQAAIEMNAPKKPHGKLRIGAPGAK